MSTWLYEQDLALQKYRILIAVRHDRLIRTIAADLGVGVQDLRKCMMDRLDMIYLENLPARYEIALAGGANAADPVAFALGSRLLTMAIPLVSHTAMEQIVSSTKKRIEEGIPVTEAIAAGKALLRGVLMTR